MLFRSDTGGGDGRGDGWGVGREASWDTGRARTGVVTSALYGPHGFDVSADWQGKTLRAHVTGWVPKPGDRVLPEVLRAHVFAAEATGAAGVTGVSGPGPAAGSAAGDAAGQTGPGAGATSRTLVPA